MRSQAGFANGTTCERLSQESTQLMRGLRSRFSDKEIKMTVTMKTWSLPTTEKILEETKEKSTLSASV